jgi:hypothetical protein
MRMRATRPPSSPRPAAQEAAAEEEEEAELKRAAAAVARLTAPEPPGPCAVSGPSGGAGGASSGSRADTDEYVTDADACASGGDGAEEPAGPAAAKLKLLQEQVLEAQAEVHAGGSEDEERSAPLTRLH